MVEKSDIRMGIAAGKLLKARRVRNVSSIVCLHVPSKVTGAGSLTLRKENGTVKGFEYKCVCGHTDAFVCE